MKVFISWSGERSRRIAEILHEWLPNVIQAVVPWMSASDIDVGARWSADIAKQLEETRFGIICLTSKNLEAPWILFEAGALSKTLEKTYVCPYLFEVEHTELTGPLVQFQAARAQMEDTRRLVHAINRALGEEGLAENMINKAFDVWWPELEKKLKSIQPDKDEPIRKRKDREILEEILELVRTQTRAVLTSTSESQDSLATAYPKTSDIYRVLQLLKEKGEPLSSTEISEQLEINNMQLNDMLYRLVRDGMIVKADTRHNRKYRLNSMINQTDQTNQ